MKKWWRHTETFPISLSIRFVIVICTFFTTLPASVHADMADEMKNVIFQNKIYSEYKLLSKIAATFYRDISKILPQTLTEYNLSYNKSE